mmetsp:Transcript_11117/g.25189  ORF Transcript_11117/g.25189 Transcript_11117/m.25189 type:complete len:811 (-) Transcript_11117:79-2511(-)
MSGNGNEPGSGNALNPGSTPSAASAIERLRASSQDVLKQAQAHGNQLQQNAQLAAAQLRETVGRAAEAAGLPNLNNKPVPCAVCGQPTLNGDGGAVGDLNAMTAEATAPEKESAEAVRVATAADLGLAPPKTTSSSSANVPRRCRSCLTAAEVEQVAQAATKREQSLNSFVAGTETKYLEPAEGGLQFGYRVSLMALGGVNGVLQWIPGISQVASIMKVIETVVRYGPMALYANEIVESVALLAFLGNQVGEKPSAQDMADLSVGAYYMMVENRNRRGLDPELSDREHQGCSPVALPELRLLSKYLILSNPIAYSTCPADAQRQLHLLDGKWGLVFAEDVGPGAQPIHFLAIDRAEKRAAVLVPGTQNAQDVVTDLKALPIRVSLAPSSKKAGWAHRGMLRAATALVRSVGPALEKLEKDGYETMFVGHSLGAGVSAMSALLMRLGDEGAKASKVKAYCYAMPACGDAVLGHFCQPFVTAVINCDDVVPRLSLQTAKKLRSELDARRADYRGFAQVDLEALKDVKGLVELKRRRGNEPEAQAPPGSDTDKQLYSQDLEDVQQVMQSAPSSRALPPASSNMGVAPPTASSRSDNAIPEVGQRPAPKARPPPTNSGWSLFSACMSSKGVGVDEEVNFDAAKPMTSKAAEEASEEETIQESFEATEVVLYPVGKLVHLYRSCGVRRAVWIKRTHPSLHRIEMEQGLAADHRGPAYKGALTEAIAYAEGKHPPKWKPFSSVTKCACCSEAFGWDSSLKSEPHKYQAQHHCHACGAVVCLSCCQARKPLPQFGISHDVRICDRCVLRADTQQGSA